LPGQGEGRGTVTSVAVLGTLAEFHDEPLPYDLSALVELVAEQRPDLLCLDITPEQWRGEEFADLSPEYQEALLPLARQTDIVVVPIASESPPPEPMATGWRGRTIRLLRGWLARLQQGASGPEAVSEGTRHFVADLVYGAAAWLAGDEVRVAWRTYTERLIDRVRETVRRDPDSRILVAVNVRHCHHVRRALGKHPSIKAVRLREL
jgi:hypothetical protein